ncbi:MAG: efflux RND transporter permease subunit, partial [Clostridiales bacterium]|nr:efflux RND transporter permease subunit [Clostridiales bacterium]
MVISDSIQVQIDHKGNDYLSIHKGVTDVSIPVLTSTLTTVFAFVPLLMLKGVAGEYMFTLPLIIIIALLASYLISIFFTPVFSSLILAKKHKKEKKYFFKNIALSILRYFLKQRGLLLFILLIIIIFTVYIGKGIGLQFFPYADSDTVYMNIKSENQQDLEFTEKKTKAILEI